MGLDEDAWQKLGFLQVGEALVKTSYMDRPAKSAGFKKSTLSAGPTDRHPASGPWSPSFMTLAALWRPVLYGASSEPDDAWIQSVMAQSAGDPHLAVFGGLRTLLTESNGGTDAPGLRALLSTAEPTSASILACAKKLWSEVVRAHYGAEMASVAAVLCRAVSPSSAWRVEALSGDGIALAAHLLSASGFGETDGWTWALSQMQGGRSSPRARTVLVQLAQDPSSEDRTGAIRAVLAMTPVVARWPTSEPPPTPSVLVLSIGRALDTMLLADREDAADKNRAVAESLVSEIEELLVRQVAAKWGSMYAQRVEEFLSRMSRFK